MNTELGIVEDRNLNINNNLKNAQENFLKTSLGQVINNAIDIGLRAVLPDLIEDELINIKDVILENGLSDGIHEAVSTAINFGKSTLGIVTGQFENINQIEMAVRKGGIIDSISDVLDFALKKANEKDLIDNSVATLIKNGKNSILNTLENRIENTIETQSKNIEKLQTYCDKWQDAYRKEDFDSMEKAYKNIDKYLNKIVPLENTIKQARSIENLHNLIKNKGKNFEISEEELKLSQKLVV